MLMLFSSLAGLIVVIAGVVLVYAATLPNEFRVTRTVRINTAREKIFPLIENLTVFNQWNPFAKQDPTIAIAYSGPESGKGAANHVGRAADARATAMSKLPIPNRRRASPWRFTWRRRWRLAM